MYALVLCGVAALYLTFAVLGRVASALERLADSVEAQNRHYGIAGPAVEASALPADDPTTPA